MQALPRLISVLSFVVLAAAVAAQDDEVNGVVTRLQGNAVAMQDAVPRPPKAWPKAKVDRAVATVTFR